MKFVQLDDNAVIPTRATHGSAGYDLHALESITIPPETHRLVKTGIGWEGMPENMVGFIWPKSGSSYKVGSDVLGGVIDSDYVRKDIGVILRNNSSEPLVIKQADSIAQLVIQEFVVMPTDITMDTREGGFGSTGK